MYDVGTLIQRAFEKKAEINIEGINATYVIIQRQSAS